MSKILSKLKNQIRTSQRNKILHQNRLRIMKAHQISEQDSFLLKELKKLYQSLKLDPRGVEANLDFMRLLYLTLNNVEEAFLFLQFMLDFCSVIDVCIRHCIFQKILESWPQHSPLKHLLLANCIIDTDIQLDENTLQKFYQKLIPHFSQLENELTLGTMNTLLRRKKLPPRNFELGIQLLADAAYLTSLTYIGQSLLFLTNFYTHSSQFFQEVLMGLSISVFNLFQVGQNDVLILTTSLSILSFGVLLRPKNFILFQTLFVELLKKCIQIQFFQTQTLALLFVASQEGLDLDPEKVFLSRYFGRQNLNAKIYYDYFGQTQIKNNCSKTEGKSIVQIWKRINEVIS